MGGHRPRKNHRSQPAQPRGNDPPRTRTRHQPHRDGTGLRHERTPTRPHPARPAPRITDRPDKGLRLRLGNGILRLVQPLDGESAAATCGPSLAAWNQHRRDPQKLAPARRFALEGERIPTVRPRAVDRVFHARPARHDPRCHPQRAFRLCEPPLVLGESAELAGHRGGASPRHGRVHH